MRSNADMTVYNHYVDTTTSPPSVAWLSTQIKRVAWENRKASNVLASGGRQDVNQATVYIPIARGAAYLAPKAWQALSTVNKASYWTLQEGDTIVKGLVADSVTPSDLKRTYDDVLTISSVDRMDNGSKALQHWKVGAQ